MRGASIFIVVALLVPNVVFAAWWNPFSWFDSWAFLNPPEDKTVETLENRVQELEAQLQGQEATTTESKGAEAHRGGETEPGMESRSAVPSTRTAPAQSFVTPSPVADVCLNLEGVQTSVPSGFSANAGICTAIQVTDLCSNLFDVQAEIPEGRTFYKNSGECLTDSEISKYEQAVLIDNSTPPEEKTDPAVAIVAQIDEWIATYVHLIDTNTDRGEQYSLIVVSRDGNRRTIGSEEANELGRLIDVLALQGLNTSDLKSRYYGAVDPTFQPHNEYGGYPGQRIEEFLSYWSLWKEQLGY